MTDKVQKIREEVEMLFNHVKDSNFESDSGAFYYLKDLLDYIDSLQEEPVSEDLEKEIDNYIKDNFFGSETYGFCSNRTGGELDCVDVVNIARHFANWQKEQMMKGAVELPLYLDGDFLTIDYDFTESGFKVGDKVKLIIIKEE